jgi:predicted anti-sigma-YlaC factor YlaD
LKSKTTKIEIKYTYRGNTIGRAIALILGIGVAIGSWNAFSNGILWVSGVDERTSTPAANSTLFFFAIGICLMVAALLPWPRFKDGRDETDRGN